MTVIAGIIIGVLAMWLRDWVLAKPSPLLKLPASELRTMLERTTKSLGELHERSLSTPGWRPDYERRLRDVAELTDALRIVEARSVEVKAPRQGVYR